MSLCKLCKGSGSLLLKQRLPLHRRFKKCTTCSGKGTSHKTIGPSEIHIHIFRKKMSVVK